MTAGRVIDLAVARARLRGGGWDELEAELVEVPDPEPGRLRYFPLPPVTARPDPRVCGDCGVGGGRHAADCPRWLTLAPALAPHQAPSDEPVLPVQLSIDDQDVS